MGVTISTFILLAMTLVTAALSIVSANYSRKKDWNHAKIYALISAGIALATVLLALFIVIKAKSSPVTGEADEFAIGVMLSFVILILAMALISALEIMSVVEMESGSSKAVAYGAGAATTALGAFILSLIVIIFLL